MHAFKVKKSACLGVGSRKTYSCWSSWEE